MAYGVNATAIMFVFALYCIVLFYVAVGWRFHWNACFSNVKMADSAI